VQDLQDTLLDLIISGSCKGLLAKTPSSSSDRIEGREGPSAGGAGGHGRRRSGRPRVHPRRGIGRGGRGLAHRRRRRGGAAGIAGQSPAGFASSPVRAAQRCRCPAAGAKLCRASCRAAARRAATAGRRAC
jgi:hypothetical protein